MHGCEEYGSIAFESISIDAFEAFKGREDNLHLDSLRAIPSWRRSGTISGIELDFKSDQNASTMLVGEAQHVELSYAIEMTDVHVSKIET